ncbi:MAG: EsaB/YukD family protein [Oscillospiraceae bacterium]|jgi:hypothetical protein|nr:EsaB/YukD family protein [Oscillospiraceae bacterium]
MNKILVEVYVPIAQRTIEIRLPVHLALSEALRLIAKLARELTDGEFTPNGETTLCRRDDGSVIRAGGTVYGAGIRNGSRLLLI